MKHNLMLTIASLLSILFMTFHLTDDIVRGMESGTLSNLTAVPILVVCRELSATLHDSHRSGLLTSVVTPDRAWKTDYGQQGAVGSTGRHAKDLQFDRWRRSHRGRLLIPERTVGIGGGSGPRTRRLPTRCGT